MDAFILAGGENKRIPVVKGFLEIQNRKIIEKNLDLLNRLFKRVLISANAPEWYFYLGSPMVGDVLDSRGPMTGILSALVSTEASDIFVIACDMPYINAILIQYIVEKWDNRFDAAIPLYEQKPQPLFGIYSKRIADKMEWCIKTGRRSIRDFLRDITVYYISEDEVKRIDHKGRSFVNINTAEDYKREGGQSCLV
jgi:molybdopterin-guanine dinucleotide biosynthesis protein A